MENKYSLDMSVEIRQLTPEIAFEVGLLNVDKLNVNGPSDFDPTDKNENQRLFDFFSNGLFSVIRTEDGRLYTWPGISTQAQIEDVVARFAMLFLNVWIVYLDLEKYKKAGRNG